MANNDIKITLKTALDAAGIEATKSQMRTLQQSVSDSMSGMAADNKTHWADIKAVWDLGCGAIRRAWEGATAGIKSAFHFETMTAQFKTLTGDIDVARAHMASLKELGDTPPFSLDEFAKASRTLMTLTDGALGYKQSLEMIGNAAAATGQPLDSVAQATGRLYAAIRDGQPISRAAGELRNMGIITPGVVAELKDLQDAGADSGQIWDVVTKRLGEYDGAMQATEQTGEGLMGAISSRWDNLVRSFGDAFMGAAKGGLAALLEKLTDLEKSGAIQAFAEKAASALATLVGWLGKTKDAIGTVIDVAGDFGRAMKDTWVDAFAIMGDVVGGVTDGLSFEEAFRQASVHQGIREGQRSADRWAETGLHKIQDDSQLRRELERGAQEDLTALKEELARQDAEEKAEEAKWQNAERKRRKEREKAEKKAAKDREAAEKKAEKDREAAEKKERQAIAKAEIEGVQRDNRREQQRFEDRIKQLNKEIADIEKAQEATRGGMATDARVNDFGKAYRYQFDKNGVIDNFTDWERAQRYAGRATRDQATRDKRRELDDKKMKDLENRLNNGEKLSKSQEKRLKNWKQFQEERDGVARRQAQIEKLREDAEKAAIEGEKHLRDIRQKMADFVEGPVLK